MAMALDRTTPEDAIVLAERRRRLRALAGRICEAVEAMPLPETFPEGERAVRAIAVADRLLERLPDPRLRIDDAPVLDRQRLRDFADNVLGAIEALPLPETFRDGERALRCVLATEKLYDQFYAPPKPSRLTFDEFAPDTDDSPEACGIRLLEKLDLLSTVQSRACGFYPDGTPIDPEGEEEDEPERLCCPEEKRLLAGWLSNGGGQPISSEQGARQLAQIMTARFNAIARAQARHAGTWLDGRVFAETDGDYYAISKAFPEMGRTEPEPGEVAGPNNAPWWMIRNPDTS